MALFVALAAALFLFNRTPSTAGGLNEFTAEAASATEPQQRRRGQRRRRPATTGRRPARDPSKFSHATPGHFENCASCHKIDALAQKETPKNFLSRSDITDYPDHDSCLSCHAQRYQPLFFRGARPVVCTICHKGAITPRNELRFDFPKVSIPSQFTDVFPHEAHFKGTSLPRFKRMLGDKAKPQDSCAFCHKPMNGEFKMATTAAVASPAATATAATAKPEEGFVSKQGAFMTTPTSHASCFECHWREGEDGRDFKPYANSCAECHASLVRPPTAMPPKPAATPAPKPGVVPAHHAVAASSFLLPVLFDDQPNPLVARHAADRFIHEIDSHKCRDKFEEKDKLEKEGKCKDRVAITCLSCHTTVRKSKTLEDLAMNKQNWVQLPSCSSSSCHTALAGSGALKLSLFRELQQRKREPAFDCAYCHLPPLSIGPEVPRSHFQTVYDSAQKELKDAQAKGDQADIKRKQDALTRVKGVIPDQFKDIIKE
ncbi:MAG: DUF1090 domain-containing protein [Acidobacteriota bacterium]|nr:DUF1090 domain-containing protein [Acidobacteriota bacterium]